MWRHLGRYDSNRPFKTWLLAIAKNTAFDYLRKKNPVAFFQLATEEQPDFAEGLPDLQPLPPELLARAETAQKISGALAKLPPQTSAVVLMHDDQGLTFQEISNVLHESINTVKSRYRRAILLLRKDLGPDSVIPV
jgi:RNA polymerase sigma-70 factor (ECF subfamily)